MAHHQHKNHHERADKICLNCGTSLYGHYCHVCGQENNEPKESAWHLIKHFAEDVTHFDGKFFSSLKNLIRKPGFLAEEYIKGRRAAYLPPVRMYLLYSAIFFLAIFSMAGEAGHTDERIAHFRDSVEEHSTSNFIGYHRQALLGSEDDITYLCFDRRLAHNGVHVYDSIQNALPDSMKDTGPERFIARRLAAAATVYHRNPNEFMEKAGEGFMHSSSKIFFFLLPVFALLLSLLYIRRKEYYFVAHAVFSIHFFCLVFMMALLYALLFNYGGGSHNANRLVLWLLLFINIGTYIYLYIAMLRFYKQGWFKTFIKWLLQSVVFTTIAILLTFAFYLNSMISLAN